MLDKGKLLPTLSLSLSLSLSLLSFPTIAGVLHLLCRTRAPEPFDMALSRILFVCCSDLSSQTII